MRTTATVLQMLVRVCAVVLVALGILFWTGSASFLVPLHIAVGLIVVLSLWTLAFMGARSGAPVGQVVVALVWGLVLPVLGLTQAALLTGGAHWLAQVLHLLVGLAAVGMAEGLAQRVKRAPAEAV